MIRYLCIGFFVVASMSSCKKDILAHAKWDFHDHGWITGDNKMMNITASDTTQAYLMDIEIEHKASYKYQNLYIRLLTTFPSGKKISSVTSLELANPDGSWAGKCGSKTCKVTLPLQRGFTFPELGKYQLTIEPYMRVDTIDGIKRMSVTCRKRAE
ncbi:MAG: gliding motility lipoprotein GldH [Saprospiraceae bacterium]|uniref:Gliding motility lipoprotein GldH n=1 Tax=Candidatus Opimibacter skivensis TaxID=2982028 RepID=A0A9D7XMV5_9BACT|nr:gliding motility lipoprotein GldH [Candidatus Opimibacter skivensis]